MNLFDIIHREKIRQELFIMKMKAIGFDEDTITTVVLSFLEESYKHPEPIDLDNLYHQIYAAATRCYSSIE